LARSGEIRTEFPNERSAKGKSGTPRNSKPKWKIWNAFSKVQVMRITSCILKWEEWKRSCAITDTFCSPEHVKIDCHCHHLRAIFQVPQDIRAMASNILMLVSAPLSYRLPSLVAFLEVT
jgi:hypothetical protein